VAFFAEHELPGDLSIRLTVHRLRDGMLVAVVLSLTLRSCSALSCGGTRAKSQTVIFSEDRSKSR
jgi:hypothetical protein